MGGCADRTPPPGRGFRRDTKGVAGAGNIRVHARAAQR